MDRLGLGYEALRTVNPGLVYCSISGYGQSGSRAGVAGHDLNYVAETGLLSLASSADGTPVVPAALVADIGGGTYPAVVNILLALLRRERTGEGAFLDIALADNVFPFLYWAIGNGLAAGQWPSPGGDLVTGGSPRYNVYRTTDGQFVAAAPLEDRFWRLSATCSASTSTSGTTLPTRRPRSGSSPRASRNTRPGTGGRGSPGRTSAAPSCVPSVKRSKIRSSASVACSTEWSRARPARSPRCRCPSSRPSGGPTSDSGTPRSGTRTPP